MNAVVFTGPTLSAREVSEIIDAVCLPPVSQGDVYRAALRHPSAIGIIDGYFEQVPSVWHKEILWAMSRGIHVFGSASMGALRAAELESFGMVGVGAIFEAYRDGVLEDDDEVAVAHGLPEEGYRGASEAMVNIRATLGKAREEGVLGAEALNVVQRIAKESFYAERFYSHILSLAGAQGAPAREVDAFRRWLRDHVVNQKRDDALAMLQTMRDFLETNPGPKHVSYVFEETAFWHGMTRCSAEIPLDSQGGPDAAVLEELRRDPKGLEGGAAAALGWLLAAEQAGREGHAVDAAALLDQSGEFCRAHQLADAAAVSAWLERNHCSRELLDHILESRALAVRAQTLVGSGLEACLLAYLRWTGDYPVLLKKAK